MRTWVKSLVAVMMMLLLMVPMVSAAPVTVGYYTFELISQTYDSTANTTTYTYTVSGTNAGQDLSHWTLALCTGVNYVSAGPGKVEVGLDPTTGVSGVKWDSSLNTNATQTYTLVVAGAPVTSGIQVVYKAGTNNFFGTIPGPSCDDPPIVNNSIFTVIKFYDANGNGIKDAGEQLVDGWKMTLTDDADPANAVTGTTGTNGPGAVNFTVSSLYNYTATELYMGLMPSVSNLAGAVWVATGPTTQGAYSGAVSRTIEFGNRCEIRGQGHTLGYWSNKNGQAEITSKNLFGALKTFALAYPAGIKFPANQADLPKWLTGASSKGASMDYMLAAQMTATWLNVNSGKLPGGSLVEGPSGWITIADALTYATTLFGQPKEVQEPWKNLFDAINNNLTPVVAPAGACDVVYPG